MSIGKGSIKLSLIVTLALLSLLLFCELAFSSEKDLALGYLHTKCQDYYQNGRYQEAKEYAKKILLINPYDEEAKRYIAQIELFERQGTQELIGAKEEALGLQAAREQELRAKEQELKAKGDRLKTKGEELRAKEEELKTRKQTEELIRLEVDAKEQELKVKQEELKAKQDELKAKIQVAEEKARLETESSKQEIEIEDKEEIEKELEVQQEWGSEDYYIQAQEHYRNQEYEQAIAGFQKAFELNPDYIEAFEYIQRCEEAVNKIREEELEIEKAKLITKQEELKFEIVELKAKRERKAKEFYIQAQEHYRNQEYEQAIAKFQKALGLNPAYVEAYKYIKQCEGNIQKEKKKEQKVKERELKARSERKAREFYLEGEQYYRNGKYEQAITKFYKALDVDPEYLEAYRYIERCEEAIQDAKEQELKAKRLELIAREKEIKSAQEELKEKRRRKARKYYIKGEKHYRHNEYEQAIDVFYKALEIDPDYVDAFEYIQRSEEKIQSEKEKELKVKKEELRAREAELRSERERKARELYLEGERHYRSGEYEEAITKFYKALEFDPSYIDAYKYIDQAKNKIKHTKEEEPEVGKEDLRKKTIAAVEKMQEELQARLDKGELIKYHYNLALSLDQRHKYEEAAAEYKKVLAIAPNDPDTHYNLGIIYDDHLKYKEKAISHYQRYLELSPGVEDTKRVEEWIARAQRYLEWDKKLK